MKPSWDFFRKYGVPGVSFLLGVTLTSSAFVFYPTPQRLVETPKVAVVKALSTEPVKTQLLAVNTAPEVGIMSAPAERSLVEQLSSSSTYEGLPVRKIDAHVVDNAKGIAILIPQTHRYPGSSFSDPINDVAEVAQNEIYGIEKTLVHNDKVTYLMNEGDVFGLVADNKINLLQEKIKATDELENAIEQFKKTVSPADASGQAVITNATKIVQLMQREITLQGGGYRVKAENVNALSLYGSENATTLAEGADIVRNYVYIEDRLAQVTGSADSATALPPTSQTMDVQGLINQLLKRTSDPGSALKSSLTAEMAALQLSGNTTVTPLVQKISDTYTQLVQLDAINTDTQTAGAPSRSDNPYASITSKSTLEAKKIAIEKQMTDVVVNKRNTETAKNFAQGLTQTNTTIGILQYGAGHEEGLTKELNKEGISVIVVTPTDVTGGENAALPD